MALPLENCVVERCMPRGYTWAKFVRCWTGDPEGSRFFEEKINPATGETMPAAYFTTLLVYDRDSGMHERAVKFQGSDAVWAQLELSERKQIAQLSCEGHVVTRSYDDHSGRQIVSSTVHIKQGSLSIFGTQLQGGRPAYIHHEKAEPNTLEDWPMPGPSIDDDLDGVPF